MYLKLLSIVHCRTLSHLFKSGFSRLTFPESILKFDIFSEKKFAYHIHRRIKPRFGAGVRDLSK